jgi:transcriptional regulator with XRE-family HTH domain
LEALTKKHDQRRSDLLAPAALAARTALPEETVRVLLSGGTPPPDTVNDRVRARIKVLAQADLARTGRRMSDLVADISQRLGVSEVWARQICDGKKVPSVELLHGLVGFFGVEGGEVFFTAPAAEALNRALLPALWELEHPQADPVQALMERYGVKGTDLRAHGSLTRDQLERVLEGVLKSVLPPQGGTSR